MNEESAINGEVIDPLDVDGRLPGGGPIEHHHEGGGANLDVKLMNMKVYGLSTINLTESKVTRSENLTDFDLNLTFSFDALVINGSYSLKVGTRLCNIKKVLLIRQSVWLSACVASRCSRPINLHTL